MCCDEEKSGSNNIAKKRESAFRRLDIGTILFSLTNPMGREGGGRDDGGEILFL